MKNFREVCSSHLFIIPENQRGFSWEQVQVEDVFNDLDLANKQAHYMGPIIVTRTDTPDFQDSDLNTVAEFTLDDGQQRVTTFFVIANELKKKLEEIDNGPSRDTEIIEEVVFYNYNGKTLRLINRNVQLNNYYKNIFLDESNVVEDSPPIIALNKVIKYVEKHLEKQTRAELIVLRNRMLNQAKFIWIDLAQENVNRYLAFDAINSRGLPLGEFDKIKNFCILVADIRKIQVQPELQWYKSLVVMQKFGVASRGSEASFVSEMYAAFHGEKVLKQEVHKNFVKKYHKLITTANTKLENDLKAFIDLWEEYAQSFAFVSSSIRSQSYGTLCNLEAGKWLDRIWNMDLIGITRPILSVCHLMFGQDDFRQVARACEIYTFRMHSVVGYRKDRNGKKIVEVASHILRYGKDKNWVVTEMCSLLTTDAPMNDIVRTLSDGRPKYYHDPRVRGWAGCYYFLYEYELWSSPSGVSPLPWAEDNDLKKNTQEHILPQSHRDRGWWQNHWGDATKAEEYKHRLGNLVLTTGNQHLGRKSIAKKLNDQKGSYCYNHRTATNSEKRISGFTDGTEWNIKNILDREYEMLEFAKKRWSVPCCLDNVTIDLPEEYSLLEGKNQIIVDEIDCYGSDGSNNGEVVSDNDVVVDDEVEYEED